MTDVHSSTKRKLADALREERLARTAAESRAEEEEALRRAAEMVNASDRMPEVLSNIASCALQACGADGSVVTQVHARTREVEAVAVAGEHIVPVGFRLPYDGSLTRSSIEAGHPLVIQHILSSGDAGIPIPSVILERCSDWSAIVIPLSGGPAARGALLLLRRPIRPVAGPMEVRRANMFGTLASIAFRKAHLLNESERRHQELEAVLQSRDRLIRGFSHDLKNPLGAADAYLQLLEMEVVGPMGEHQRPSLSRARRAIARGLELIDALVELARADAGRLDVRRESVDVRQLVDETVDEYRGTAVTNGPRLRVELDDELPVIASDAERIRQVLANLLSNAIKYTDVGGRVTVSVEVGIRRAADVDPAPSRRRAGGTGWLCITVADTGAGIPADKRGLLFREFVRLNKDASPGVGLGLAISGRIARALGGEITVESEPGSGSAFRLWLPLGQRPGDGGSATN
jgi:signal transduction histidine kinase